LKDIDFAATAKEIHPYYKNACQVTIYGLDIHSFMVRKINSRK